MAPRRRRVGEIIRAMRREAGLDQAELADRVNEITGHAEGKGRVTQPRISDLERNSELLERDLANLAAIDEACGFEPGHIQEVAGYVHRAGETDLETAIETFPAPLDARDRHALLVLYRALKAGQEGNGPVSPLPRTPGMTRAEEELRRATAEREGRGRPECG